MRHYERVSYRHLDDSERYRDYDYLADDWLGPNERAFTPRTEAQEVRRVLHGSEPTTSVGTQPERERERERDRERLRARGRLENGMRAARDIGDAIRHPGSFVGRMVRGLFHGKGPKNWIRSDARIHDEVCEVLAAHPEIDASDVEVVVKDGEVTLDGSVGDRRTKRLAESVLDDVLGLHDVHNRLIIAR